MTGRTPPTLMYPNYNTEKSNEIDYNGTNTNKAGINQSSVGGNNNTTTNENRPANRGYRKPVPHDNFGALFDIEYLYIPRKREKEIKKQDPSDDDVNARKEENTALERSVEESKDKAEVVDHRLGHLDTAFDAGPESESDMARDGYRMNDLEIRNQRHSAQIHALERELRNVRMENSQIKGQLVGQDERNGFDERGGYMGRIQERHETKGNVYPDPGYPEIQDSRPEAEPAPPPGRRQYANEQHRIAHRQGGPDEERYWGLNRYYNPQYITAYRRECYAKVEEREKQTQYADDYNYLHEMQRRQEEEWRRKRLAEEERFMKDKPRTFEYTAPYQSHSPPRDINKYFHDSKYYEDIPEPKSDEYYFKQEAYQPLQQKTGVSTYERAYIPPRYRDMAETRPGGLYILRFHGDGFRNVELAFREQQTIVKTYEGRVLGIAGKRNVFAIEGDADWHYSRNQQPRPQIDIQYKCVEDAIAAIWFPSLQKADQYNAHHHNNRFYKDPAFPTQHSWEAHFISLLAKPFLREFDTYLVIEVLQAQKYSPQQIQRFDTDTREAILQFIPNSIPFVASTAEGHKNVKSGSTTLLRDRSKVFISLFTSLSEISNLWKKGIIQYKLAEWNINGPINVWAFALKDYTE